MAGSSTPVSASTARSRGRLSPACSSMACRSSTWSSAPDGGLIASVGVSYAEIAPDLVQYPSLQLGRRGADLEAGGHVARGLVERLLPLREDGRDVDGDGRVGREHVVERRL